MEKVLEEFMGMMAGGFTMAGVGMILQYFVGACILLGLYKSGNRFIASVFIKKNRRLVPGETWLGMQNNGGVAFVGKYLKCGWFKTFVLNCDSGGLLEFSTNEFNDSAKHYLPCAPETDAPHIKKNASDFGL